MTAGKTFRRHLLLVIAALCIITGLLASGCLWGVVTNVDTGAGISGATVTYTDSEGHSQTTTTTNGLYAFDIATGPVPAVGPATFEVSAPEYEPLTATRSIQYNDNPHATLENPSSFWEVQHFDLVPEGPSGSVHILDYTPFDTDMLSGDTVSATVEYEASGPFEFMVTFGYEAKALKAIWWCDDSFPVSPGSGTLVVECSLGPWPDWAPSSEYPYPHAQGVVEVLLQYEADPMTYELVAGEFVIDDEICPSDDEWAWPVCP
jgi:hypothetical protein